MAGPVAWWLSSHTLLLRPGVHGFGSQAQTCILLIRPSCGSIPHIKQRKMGTDVSSATIFLKQKEEDWQQSLAQDQSSSPKIKRKVILNWPVVTADRSVVALSKESGWIWWRSYKGHKESFGGEGMFTVFIRVMVSRIYTHVNAYPILRFFFLRKISPELRWCYPPPVLLFMLRKTGLELTSVLIALYFIFGMPATAWLGKGCGKSTPGSEPGNARLLRRSAHSTTAPSGRPQLHTLITCDFLCANYPLIKVLKKVVLL